MKLIDQDLEKVRVKVSIRIRTNSFQILENHVEESVWSLVGGHVREEVWRLLPIRYGDYII